jgi:DNA-binding protein H-NS
MADINLDTLSHDDLMKLRRDIAKAIESYDARKKKEAKAAVEAKAKALGFSLAELASETKASRAVNPPKYKHPEDPEKTWTGRGRQPAWVKEHVEAGKPLEELLIA